MINDTQKNDLPLCSLWGAVTHGRGKGRAAGMPTANLAMAPGQTPPPQGVYAVLVSILGARYIGVTNVGLRPSADDDAFVTVETFILDLDADLYGQPMRLDFYQYLRPTRKMPSLAAVKQQVERDAQAARALLGALNA